MAKELVHFGIVRRGEEYLITIEDGVGETTEFLAPYDQLDLISEAIDTALDSDEEEELAVDAEDEEE